MNTKEQSTMVEPIQEHPVKDSGSDEHGTFEASNTVNRPASQTKIEQSTVNADSEQPVAFAPLPNWDKELKPSREPWSLKRKAIVFGSAGLAAVTLITTLAVLPPKDNKPSDNPTGKSDTTPTAVASPSPSETQAPPSAETFKATGEIQKQTVSIEAMDKMDLNTFAQLPFADRFAYVVAKIPNYAFSTPASDPETQGPTTNVPFTKGQDVTAGDWNTIIRAEFGNANTTEGAKIISVLDYTAFDTSTGQLNASYKSLSDGVLQTGGAGKGPASSFISVTEGPWQSAVDSNSNTVDYFKMSYNKQTNDGTIQDSLNADVVRIAVQTLDGKTFIGYSAGALG